MKLTLKRTAAFLSAMLLCCTGMQLPAAETTASAASGYVVEYLDRGINAINTGSGMLVSWRFLANDADNTVFRLYRDGNLIYTSEAGMATCYLDKGGNASSSYRVETVVGGTVTSSDTCEFISNTNYFNIPMDVPPAGSDYTYSPNDCSTDKKLVKRWGYDTGYNRSAAGYGNGNHNAMPADVDGDGRQELVLGATCIDDNGSVLWCNWMGHGDAMHLSDFLPDRAGQELWVCHEHAPYGVSLLDAKDGSTIFHYDPIICV